MRNIWGAAGLGSELLHCGRESIHQEGAIWEGLREEKGFEEGVEGEERLFGTGEDGTALDLKSAPRIQNVMERTSGSVIFMIIKEWVEWRRHDGRGVE